MPEPVPEPTAAQLVLFSGITMIAVNDVLAVISANASQDISNAQWAQSLIAFDSWPDIRDEGGDIKRVGSIEFFENKAISTRLDFRNWLRLLYGLPLLVSDSGESDLVVSSLEWF